MPKLLAVEYIIIMIFAHEKKSEVFLEIVKGHPECSIVGLDQLDLLLRSI